MVKRIRTKILFSIGSIKYLDIDSFHVLYNKGINTPSPVNMMNEINPNQIFGG